MMLFFFSHPDYTVGIGILACGTAKVPGSHRFNRRSGSRTIPPV